MRKFERRTAPPLFKKGDTVYPTGYPTLVGGTPDNRVGKVMNVATTSARTGNLRYTIYWARLDKDLPPHVRRTFTGHASESALVTEETKMHQALCA